MRQLSSLIASLALAALLGCTAYRPVETDVVVPPSTNVRANFDEPRVLVVRDAFGNTSDVAQVMSVEGELMSRTEDTLTLELSRVRVLDAGRLRTVRYGDEAYTSIPTQTLERRQVQVVESILVGAVVVVGLMVLVAASMSEPDYQPEPKPDGSGKTT